MAKEKHKTFLLSVCPSQEPREPASYLVVFFSALKTTENVGESRNNVMCSQPMLHTYYAQILTTYVVCMEKTSSNFQVQLRKRLTNDKHDVFILF